MKHYNIVLTDGARLSIKIPVRARITAYRIASQITAISGLAAHVLETKVMPRRRRTLKISPAYHPDDTKEDIHTKTEEEKGVRGSLVCQ